MREGGFRRDLGRLVDTSRPVALARFGDGEYHVLGGTPYSSRSGWVLHGQSWIRRRLDAALRASLPGYWVGISPPCDWPLGTAYFRPRVTARRTFATVFSHSNYPIFRRHLQRDLAGACLVGPGAKADHRVPPNGVLKKWDLDGLVDCLLKETRPILVAAGPCACVIVHEYWKRCPAAQRQTILDVGAAVDPLLHGESTREFHDTSSPLRTHVCDWERSVPWSPGKKKKLKGYRAVQAGHRTKYGGKLKP